MFTIGCKVYVQGRNEQENNAPCAFSGDEMWAAYQEIRRSGCAVCGSRHFGNGCLISIDADPKCPNTSNGWDSVVKPLEPLSVDGVTASNSSAAYV